MKSVSVWRNGSWIYFKACPDCGGDVLCSPPLTPEPEEFPDRELLCIQCGRNFNRRDSDKVVPEAPPEGMTSRQYVEERLVELEAGKAVEIPHVHWLTCKGPKAGCTLATAIRDYRNRTRTREYVQRHGYPAVWVRRLR